MGMAKETVHIIQAYKQGRGKSLKAEQQVGCANPEEARRKAERLLQIANACPIHKVLSGEVRIASMLA